MDNAGWWFQMFQFPAAACREGAGAGAGAGADTNCGHHCTNIRHAYNRFHLPKLKSHLYLYNCQLHIYTKLNIQMWLMIMINGSGGQVSSSFMFSFLSQLPTLEVWLCSGCGVCDRSECADCWEYLYSLYRLPDTGHLQPLYEAVKRSNYPIKQGIY